MCGWREGGEREGGRRAREGGRGRKGRALSAAIELSSASSFHDLLVLYESGGGGGGGGGGAYPPPM